MDVTGTIDTKNPAETHKEVSTIYERRFGSAIPSNISLTMDAIVDLFEGRYPGYQKCDPAYHDLEHTLQAYLAAARICDGLAQRNSSSCPEELMIASLIASLGHDTGFIKENGDEEGTGAKYSLIHVERSKSFMGEHLQKIGFKTSLIHRVKNAISCTGLDGDLSKIPFSSEEERFTGYVVGTADFLGQMSDPDYVQKLPSLYLEYSEGGVPGYNSSGDLMSKTPEFFEVFVMKRLTDDLKSVYKYAADHFGGKDLYIEGIQKNISQIECDNP